MDIDSLVYQIKTEDFYEDITKAVKARFDTSGYSKKDARPEFVALRPELYAYRKLDGEDDKRCKGIKKCVVKKTLGFDDYKNCLLDAKSRSIYRQQLMFRNRKHEVPAVKVNKAALNRDDDKRIAKKDRINTLVCGHNSLCWNSLLGEISLS